MQFSLVAHLQNQCLPSKYTIFKIACAISSYPGVSCVVKYNEDWADVSWVEQNNEQGVT